MRGLKACVWLLPCLLAVGCVQEVGGSDEELGSMQQAATFWPDGTYAKFFNSGRMYATHKYTDISYMQVIAAAAGSNWSLDNPERFRVMVDAMNEAREGRCGDVARSR